MTLFTKSKSGLINLPSAMYYLLKSLHRVKTYAFNYFYKFADYFRDLFIFVYRELDLLHPDRFESQFPERLGNVVHSPVAELASFYEVALIIIAIFAADEKHAVIAF